MTRLAIVACLTALGCGVESMATLPQAPAETSVVVELDVLDGLTLDEAELQRAVDLAEAVFLAEAIKVEFEVDHSNFDAPPRLVDAETKTMLMKTTRDRSDAIHLVVAARGAGAHGVVHYERGPDASPRSAGVFIFADSIAADFDRNPLLADAGLEASQLFARSLAHELGHALGCRHPEIDSTSVMAQNSQLGAITAESIGRWHQALATPRFEQQCLDIEARLSVELAQPAYSQ